jgi:hypothetical protein
MPVRLTQARERATPRRQMAMPESGVQRRRNCSRWQKRRTMANGQTRRARTTRTPMERKAPMQVSEVMRRRR